MSLSKKILNLALSIVNACTFFLRQKKNRITFISMTQNHLDQDFALLDTELKKSGQYDLRYNLIVYKNTLADSARYFFNCLKQLIEFKRSALIILNDNNYIAANFKPKDTKVLQVWHACGAVKKFGNQIQRSYPIQGYDMVLSSSDYWKPVYAQAFGVEEKRVLSTGLPRNDVLLDYTLQEKQVSRFLEKHPELTGKKIILYAPTFRGNILDGLRVDSFDIAKVLDALDEDTFILYKFHPLLDKVEVNHPRAMDVSDEDLYMLMHASECMISDYSSVILDYALLGKPMISYIDDLQEYTDTIGLNIEYQKEFPGPIARNDEELIAALKQPAFDAGKLLAFQKKYIQHTDGKNTSRAVKEIDAALQNS